MAKVLVLGGAGFIGRHACEALLRRGHEVVVGTRHPRRAGARLGDAVRGCERREAHLDWLTAPANWSALLRDVDVVVNAVGILRERGYETYERVHYRGPSALAAACRARAIRLVHLSALGLRPEARSRFIRSKLWAESAVTAAGGDYVIVRPSLLDGPDGFGARWLRRVARWGTQIVPANGVGRIAALHVDDLAEAIAALCDPTVRLPWREADLGGPVARPLPAYLGALRASAGLAPARVLKIPGWVARMAAHALDVLHVSPFSFGHYELLRWDNVPLDNRLNFLLGRAPTPLGERAPRELSLPALPAQLPNLRDAGGPAS